MPTEPRRAKLRALAKLNLTLEIVSRRDDGYHDLRTIFQTISLADTLEVEYTPARARRIALECDIDIRGNLAVRAAESVLDASGARGHVRFRLTKRIPMGSGLGGGSSDAAAVLLALPVLTGRPLPLEKLIGIGASLGSDVPFFLAGGTALGLGRGTEVYPLESMDAGHVLVIAPAIHVSTAEAYQALGRPLTSSEVSHKMNVSQSLAWASCRDSSSEGWSRFCSNDFESVVFERHPQLRAIKNKLNKAGALPALMTGSGAAVFGIFNSVEAMRRAQQSFQEENVVPASFVSRSAYHALWWKQLTGHIEGKTWPPRSRHLR
jgi:4-diphosphocytidyl-2-C-methyl-D-erythritol kinase